MNKKVEELLNAVAYRMHYDGWYKNSIEGKFGLETDGYDHGRFRPSKDASMDKEFFAGKEFDENGYSKETDEHGSPYYKREEKDGKVVYYVDSAIKGWDFLPPSWKYENIKGAEVVLKQIRNSGTLNLKYFITEISNNIHKKWVARQLASEFGGDANEAHRYGRLTKEDVAFLKGETEVNKNPSMLFNKLGKEKLAGIWGFENFVEFKDLPFEEQIKDTNLIVTGLEVLSEFGDDYAKDQLKSVKDAVEKITQKQSYEQNLERHK